MTTPYATLLEPFDISRLTSRRKTASLMFLYKIFRSHYDDPVILNQLTFRIPAFRSRTKTLFQIPRSRTVSCGNSPLNRMMALYNNLLSDLPSAQVPDLLVDSKQQFKKKCQQLENTMY